MVARPSARTSRGTGVRPAIDRYTGRTREEYTIPGRIFIVSPGAGEAVADRARARAFAIFNAVAGTVRADPSLGGVVLRSGPVSPGSVDELPVEEGRGVIIGLRLPVYTELTP
jgi:hypothetical protein